jgi:hypothetical protein
MVDALKGFSKAPAEESSSNVLKGFSLTRPKGTKAPEPKKSPWAEAEKNDPARVEALRIYAKNNLNKMSDLEKIRMMDAIGAPLPQAASGMYDESTVEDAQEIEKIYQRQPETERAVSSFNTYRGDAIPNAPPTDIPYLPDRTAYDMGQDVMMGTEDFLGNIVETGAGLVDKSINSLAGEDVSNLSGAVREARPNFRTDSLGASIVQEGTKGALSLAGPKGMGLSGKAARVGEAALYAAGSDSEDEMGIARNTVSYLTKMYDPELAKAIQEGRADETLRNDVATKTFHLMEFAMAEAAAASIGKVAKLGKRILYDGVIEPNMAFFREKSAQRKLIAHVVDDLATPLQGLNPQQRNRAMVAIREAANQFGNSIEKAKKTGGIPSDTFTSVSDGLRALAELEENADIKAELIEVANRSVGLSKSNVFSGMDTIRDTVDRRLKAPGETVTGAQSNYPGAEEVPGLARKSTERTMEMAEDAKNAIPDQQRKVLESVTEMRDEVKGKVRALYEDLNTKIGGEPISPKTLKAAKLAGYDLPEDASYEDIFKLNKDLGNRLRTASENGDTNTIMAIQQLRADIYLNEPERIANALGDPGIAEEALAARDYARDKYFKWFSNTSGAPDSARSQIDSYNLSTEDMNAPGATGTSGVKAGTKALQSELADGAQNQVIDDYGKMVDDISSDKPRDFQRLETMRGGPRQADIAKQNADKSRSNIEAFTNPDDATTLDGGVERLPASPEAQSTQFQEFFSEGAKKPSAVISEMKRNLNPEEFKIAISGLKNEALENVKRNLTDAVSGRVTAGKYKENFNRAFAVLEATAEEGDKKAFAALKKAFMDVGESQTRSEGFKGSIYPKLGPLLGKAPAAESKAGTDKVITWYFGVLNTVATRLRQMSNAFIKSGAQDVQDLFSREVDRIISEPEYFIKQMDDLLAAREKGEVTIDTMRELLRTSAVYGKGISEDPAFEEELELMLESFIGDEGERAGLE